MAAPGYTLPVWVAAAARAALGQLLGEAFAPPLPASVSPVLREFAGTAGVIPVPSPTLEDPSRKVYIPFVLVPPGMEVVLLPEAPNNPQRLPMNSDMNS